MKSMFPLLLLLIYIQYSLCLAMVKYELLYFNGAGRAETTRLMLSAAGIDFDDTRFAFPEWPEIKPTTPLGSVPVLKVDGVDYCQSVALSRYAAKLAGFYPEDPLQALGVDEAMDCINEMVDKFPFGPFESEDEKKAARQEFQKGPATKYADFAEKKIQATGGKGFASTPSVADVMLMCQVSSIQSGLMDYIDTGFYDSYPGIMATCKAIKETLMENEGAAAYLKSRET